MKLEAVLIYNKTIYTSSRRSNIVWFPVPFPGKYVDIYLGTDGIGHLLVQDFASLEQEIKALRVGLSYEETRQRQSPEFGVFAFKLVEKLEECYK